MDDVNQRVSVPPISKQTPAKTANNLSFLKALAYGFAIVSFGIAIAVGGYLLGLSKNKPQPITQTSVAPSASPASDPTANWKTYKNEKYGFEIKYPSLFADFKEAPYPLQRNHDVAGYSIPAFFSAVAEGTAPSLNKLKSRFNLYIAVFPLSKYYVASSQAMSTVSYDQIKDTCIEAGETPISYFAKPRNINPLNIGTIKACDISLMANTCLGVEGYAIPIKEEQKMVEIVYKTVTELTGPVQCGELEPTVELKDIVSTFKFTP